MLSVSFLGWVQILLYLVDVLSDLCLGSFPCYTEDAAFLLVVLFVSRHWIFKRKNKHRCPNVTFLERRLSWHHRCVESCCANEQHLMNGNSL